jgi:hypothetical protein
MSLPTSARVSESSAVPCLIKRPLFQIHGIPWINCWDTMLQLLPSLPTSFASAITVRRGRRAAPCTRIAEIYFEILVILFADCTTVDRKIETDIHFAYVCMFHEAKFISSTFSDCTTLLKAAEADFWFAINIAYSCMLHDSQLLEMRF